MVFAEAMAHGLPIVSCHGGYSGAVIGHQDVFWFQVAVHNPCLVRGVEALEACVVSNASVSGVSAMPSD
jgi:hypothetical protein